MLESPGGGSRVLHFVLINCCNRVFPLEAPHIEQAAALLINTPRVLKKHGVILRRAPAKLTVGQWQREGSKFKASLLESATVLWSWVKGDAGGPPGPALTLIIKEETISVKHVFSAFTLYANVLRRVKVPFDEEPSRSSSEGPFTGSCTPPSIQKKKKTNFTLYLLLFNIQEGF